MKSSDKPIKETILPTDDQNMLAENHNDEKLVTFDREDWLDCLSISTGLNAFGLGLWAN